MKSEEEIKEMLGKLDNKSINELSDDGFVDYSDKAGHWEDCLRWVLK